MAKRAFVERVIETAAGPVITVRLYAPVPVDRDWRCDHEVRFDDELLRTRGAMGADSLQALVLSAGLAELMIRLTARNRGFRVTAAELGDLKKFAVKLPAKSRRISKRAGSAVRSAAARGRARTTRRRG